MSQRTRDFAPIILILSTFLVLSFKIQAQSAITDPAISLRCRELIDARRNKVVYKQRLMALINRNDKLQRIAPTERESVIEKLKDNKKRLEREHELSVLKIQKQEEVIIRQGCPGIQL